jgi:hypothetical protein
MSIESVRKRLEAATPTEWRAASGRGKLSVVGTIDKNGHSYALAVFSAVPATHRAADADLTAHAPTDLAVLLAVAEAAKEYALAIGEWAQRDQFEPPLRTLKAAKKLSNTQHDLEAAD